MDSLNGLIGTAQALLKNGFDIEAYLTWKSLAFLVLLGQLGPFHYYTRNFINLTAEANKRGLLAGKGLLAAAKEEISTSSRKTELHERSSSRRKLAASNTRTINRKKWYPLCLVQQCHRHG